MGVAVSGRDGRMPERVAGRYLHAAFDVRLRCVHTRVSTAGQEHPGTARRAARRRVHRALRGRAIQGRRCARQPPDLPRHVTGRGYAASCPAGLARTLVTSDNESYIATSCSTSLLLLNLGHCI